LPFSKETEGFSAMGRSVSKSASYQAIYGVVRRIPRGKVATYGTVAKLAGIPGHAREVGYALHALPEGSTVPWHRVINARGRISLSPSDPCGSFQKAILEKEGVVFGEGGSVSLHRFGWPS
jgi:methylated-DNA-protein-cysteine methyltransferase-like protein